MIPRLVVFDIDGTLADNRKRLQQMNISLSEWNTTSLETKDIENTYLLPENLLQDPNYPLITFKLQYFLTLRDDNPRLPYGKLKVGIITARPTKCEPVTIEWLKLHHIDPSRLDFLIHRPSAMAFSSAVRTWKKQAILEQRAKFKLTEIELFDDDSALLALFENINGEFWLASEGQLKHFEFA